jgi:hypothetical protein
VLETHQCPGGRLQIAFSPWEVVKGTGEFEGLRGRGWMVARFEKGTRNEGLETFTGTISP